MTTFFLISILILVPLVVLMAVATLFLMFQAKSGNSRPMLRAIVRGVIWALVGVFPVAALVALCFRFPFPMVGYLAGVEAARLSPMAVVFYGMMGGFVLVAVLGAISGVLAYWLAGSDIRKGRWFATALALGGDFVVVITLAVLDKIVGPW